MPVHEEAWVTVEEIVPASYPLPLEREYTVERRTDKPLDSEEDLVVAVTRIERVTRGL